MIVKNPPRIHIIAAIRNRSASILWTMDGLAVAKFKTSDGCSINNHPDIAIEAFNRVHQDHRMGFHIEGYAGLAALNPDYDGVENYRCEKCGDVHNADECLALQFRLNLLIQSVDPFEALLKSVLNEIDCERLKTSSHWRN